MTTIESGLSATVRTQADDPSRSVRVNLQSSLSADVATKDPGKTPVPARTHHEARNKSEGSAEQICATDVHPEERHTDSWTDTSPNLLTLIVDNYDSFTYSIVQYLASINGVSPLVVKNDDFPTWDALKKSLPNFDNIVISPGPGHPANADDFGISSAALQEASLPTLGICLGHQGLAHICGGNVTEAPEPVHGRKSVVDFLEGYDLFRGIKHGTSVLRYHSLIVEKASLPACLEVSCWTRDEQRLIMGMRHKQLPLHSVQFHPESIGTADGFRMLENFKKISLAWWKEKGGCMAGSARLEGVDALSITLVKENRAAALAVAAEVKAAVGGPGSAENDCEGPVRGEAVAAPEKLLETERPARDSAATADVTGAKRVVAEGVKEENAAAAGVRGWVVNIAMVSRVRGSKGTQECEQRHQQPRMDVEGDGRSRNVAYDQSVVFKKLFSKEDACFWLDSSSADERCAGVHAKKRYSRRSCFSYMGGCSGPFAEAVEYYEKEKKVVIRDFTFKHNTETDTLQQANLLPLLASRLQRFSPATKKDSHIPSSRSTTGLKKNCRLKSNHSSTRKLHRPRRGSCSNVIETRWWDLCDGALKEATKETSLYCDGALQASTTMASHDKSAEAPGGNVRAGATVCTGQHARSSMKQGASSRTLPPCGFLGGYVGFFGYELRHLMEFYDSVNSPVLAPLTESTPAAAGRRKRCSKNTITKAVTSAGAAYFQGCDQACKEKLSSADGDSNHAMVTTRNPPQQDSLEKVTEHMEKATENKGSLAMDEHEKTHIQREQHWKYRERQTCDAVWLFADRVVAFDLENNTTYLLWLTLPLNAAATYEGEMKGTSCQQECNTSCDQRAGTEQSAASTILGKAPSADYAGKASAKLLFASSPTTASSVSHLTSLGDSCSSLMSPSSLTYGRSVTTPTEAAAGKGNETDLLQMPVTSPSDNEGGYTCSAIESIQLAWANQTLQQLLHLEDDMDLTSDAPARTMVETKRKERGENSARRSKTNTKEKDEGKGNEEDAATAMARELTYKEENSNGNITEGRTQSGAAEGAGRQGGAVEKAKHKQQKVNVNTRQEEEVVNGERGTFGLQRGYREEANGGDGGGKGEKEKETNLKEHETKVLPSALPFSVELNSDSKETVPSASTAVSVSSSPASLAEPSPFSIPHSGEWTSWLLHPRDTKQQYLDKIKKISSFIHSGDAYEMCLTTEFSGYVPLQAADLFAFYTFLRKRNPSPFSVFFRYQPQAKSSKKLSSFREEKKGNPANVSCKKDLERSQAEFGTGALSVIPALASESLWPATAVGASLFVASSESPTEVATACPSFTVCCASPELFLLLDKEGWVESRPIKGTRPRGKTAAEDAVLAQDLATSEKDAAENMMVVDVTRSDLGRVSVPGTVCVPELLVVESYSHVHQLVSTIRGKLRAELSFFDAVAAAFPGASMTGAPKKRAMKLLYELEQRERGLYSGAIGFLSVDRQAALNIAIRTLVFYDDGYGVAPGVSTKQANPLGKDMSGRMQTYTSSNVDLLAELCGGVERGIGQERATLGTGGAIIAASKPEEEVEEMQLKADSVLSPLHEFLSSSRFPSALYGGGDTNCNAATPVVW